MSRQRIILTIALWGAVLFTALAVVVSTQKVRDLTTQLALLQSKQNRIQIEWGQYLLEESSLASFARLESVATEELGLRSPELAEVRVLER